MMDVRNDPLENNDQEGEGAPPVRARARSIFNENLFMNSYLHPEYYYFLFLLRWEGLFKKKKNLGEGYFTFHLG